MRRATAGAMVIAHLDDNLIALGRVLGALRRRNLAVRSTASGPTAVPGVIRFTARLDTDPATAEAVAQQLRKTVGVREVGVRHGDAEVQRELALVRVRPAANGRAGLFDAVSLYRATVVDEDADEVVVELAGDASFVVSFLRALEPFGAVDVARSGAITLDHALPVAPPLRAAPLPPTREALS